MGWTTRNHEKSGSNPSLKLAVEIQSSALGSAEVCGIEGAAAASVGRGRLEERERDGERE